MSSTIPAPHNSDHAELSHKRLLFVGESNPETTMLMNLTSERFGLPAVIFDLDGLPINDLAKAVSDKPDALIILDCLTLTEKKIKTFLQAIDSERQPGVVLFNVEPNTEPEKLGKWTQIVGIQHTNIDPELFLKGFEKILNGGLWLPRSILESMVRRGSREKFWKTTGYVYPDLGSS